jgi:hypothetical protein
METRICPFFIQIDELQVYIYIRHTLALKNRQIKLPRSMSVRRPPLFNLTHDKDAAHIKSNFKD